MADFIARFNKNLEKIDSLALSFYEKDLLFSAYYNHLNHLEISPQARELMKALGISFKHKNIIFESKTLDSHTLQSNAQNNQPKEREERTLSLFALSLFECSERAKTLQIESEHFLEQIKLNLEKTLHPQELAFLKISAIYQKLEQEKTRLQEALSELTANFLQGFENLEAPLQDEITQKANALTRALEKQKNFSAKLCFKILEIKNAQTKNPASLETLINELDAYLQNI